MSLEYPPSIPYISPEYVPNPPPPVSLVIWLTPLNKKKEQDAEKWIQFGSYKVSSKCFSEYKLQNKVGEGTKGEIFQVCENDGKCQFVVKIFVHLDEVFDHPNFVTNLDEAQVTKQMGDLNIGPKVYKTGQCDMKRKREKYDDDDKKEEEEELVQGSFIVMEKMDITVEQYAKEFPSHFLKYEKEIQAHFKLLFRRLHQLNILHRDWIMGNLMMNINPITKKPIRYALIDFGAAEYFKSQDDPEFKKKSKSEIHGVEDELEDLVHIIKNPPDPSVKES